MSQSSIFNIFQSIPYRLWLSRLGSLSILLIGMGIGFLVPYMMYLDKQVIARFGELRWQLPTRVYARPLELVPQRAMDSATLLIELKASSYQEDSQGVLAGTYKIAEKNTFVISSRGYNDVDGKVPARRIEVSFADGKVSKLKDLSTNKAISSARLDPSRIATLYGQKQEERRLVQAEEVPILLVTGLQAVEDRSFKSHFGIDPKGMVRAVWIWIRSGGKTKQGASTLTQQLARSGLLGIGKEQTITRKFNEILYAILMEWHYNKELILEAYLNQVYFGQRGDQVVHGVASGAEFWFGRDLSTLSTDQVALLIGLVKGPGYYDPRRYPERALDRRNFVLKRLAENQLITPEDYKKAAAMPLGVPKEPGLVASNRYSSYVDLVRRQLANDYPESALQGAGLIVHTGMSPSAQYYAEQSVSETIKKLQTDKRPVLQTGLVLTDVHNGDVLALVGAAHVDQVGFNRALEANRPVGSLLKPFVYLLALTQPDRYSLASWVEDSPIHVPIGKNRSWSPNNSDRRSHGTVRLVDALAQSYNQAAVRVGMDVGPTRLSQLLQVLSGIKTETNPALILGATEQTPYAMTQLYQFLASGGEIQPLHSVRGVLGGDATLLSRYDKEPAPAQSGDSIAANLVSVGLQRVVSNGTAKQLNSEGLGKLASAGKTGTSNDGRDSWYAGYTGDHLAVVWMGNDMNEQTGLYGSTGAMRIWSGIFKKLPSKALQVKNESLEQQWIESQGTMSTDASCPNVRSFLFVTGFTPPYAPCGGSSEETFSNSDQSSDSF